ncbi:hypothetical protein [Aneurinibacillus migulanus]|uniref:Prophage P2a protein 33 n=1 Tax=Aneurinibacillus migulanus TaxID=47500 RepID=A0A0D1WGL6_ANEMI|nr:hypothetical protein [Aneurinibacillus migulanus]KIV57675.1 prophage P2a protein 33 [Aneurinibacillus migulanus]KON95855.1 prophage P2a protein 33 [Aneurinibacillus migulanus]MED0891940.1 hypothetical protein [Aneurinibacillus migulanus]MED1617320.1 hypothetical protein [Aneurinibacillus migulanus]SDK26106.1 hypothetical protein SAMN04487909_14610 [Aneurinibacillus migulanus]
MAKYRKKPIVVEAEHFTEENKDKVFHWITCTCDPAFIDGKPVIKIQTLEGVMIASLGDYVIKGVNGEFYPCREDIFKATYELAEE